MTTTTNYGEAALSAIEAYIIALEAENVKLRHQLHQLEEQLVYGHLITELEAKSALGEIE